MTESQVTITFSCTLDQAIATRNILQKFTVPEKPPMNIKLMLAFNGKLHKAIVENQGKKK